MYRYPLNGGGDKRAGAALPIFARKRPRVALMAFSNSQTTNSEQTVQHHRQEKSSAAVTRGQLDKENTASGSYGGKEKTAWSAYKPVHGHVTTALDAVQSRSNPRPYWEESHDLQSYDVHVTKETTGGSSGNTSITNNDQPLVQPRDHVIQSQLMNSVHLLTATSQGVQHWAGYRQHINLMFEVFGTLSSPIEQGEMGAKRFTLQAVDGPLNCLFWEIDYKILSTLTRGHLCRVVGKWDAQNSVLKCVSIRLANPNEWNSVKTMVATSDKYMRQMASSLNEM